MAKGPGWYPDPWGGQGLRWWDGSNWTEHVQGQPPAGYAPGVSVRGGPLVTAPGTGRSWYHQWWFIALMLFVCCWPIGLVLTWSRPSTPTSIKLFMTIGWILLSFLIAAAWYSLAPESYQTGTNTGF